MSQEEKQLLLKDISARLPYGIIVHIHDINVDDYDRQLIGEDLDFIELDRRNCKPYLRPMSSMAEEEERELSKNLNYEFYIDDDFALAAEDDRHRIRLDLLEGYIEWLNKHHFDFRGLIEKGLAIEAPKGMYKSE